MPMLKTDRKDRYSPNNKPLQALSESPKELFLAALETLVTETPPPVRVPDKELFGIFAGYIGIPHMLLQLSSLHPDVQVQGKDLRQWAQAYLASEWDEAKATGGYHVYGTMSEQICRKAMAASISGRDADVDALLDEVSKLGKVPAPGEKDEYDTDLTQGRAGALYLLRLVRSWVPASKVKIDAQMKPIAERLLESNGHGERSWKWMGMEFLGAVHGDIGNITQLVLSLPELAPVVEAHLGRLLDMQLADGGWPSLNGSEDSETEKVQLCHGPPGFLYSLIPLRPYFPALQDRIDAAIAKARECVWEKGLLKKEPSLCHGIFGNAL